MMKLHLPKLTFTGLLGLALTIFLNTGLMGQYGPTLVENGGIEQGFDVYWDFSTLSGGVGSAIGTTDAAEGTNAVEITVTSCTALGKIRYRSPEITPGLHADTGYVFRLKAKSPEALSMKISLKVFGTLGSKNKNSEVFTLTNQYEEYSFILYPPIGYNDKIQVIIQTGDTDESGKVYLDDISLKKYEGDDIINNDFEEGINFGWALQVKEDENAAGTFSEETSSVASGSIALKAEVSAISSVGGFGGVNALSSRKLIAADKYLIGCYFKGGAEGDSVSFGPQDWDEDSKFLSNSFYQTALTTDWLWYFNIYEATETAKWLGSKALLAAKVGTIYMDKLTIGEITAGNITSTASLDAQAFEEYSYQVTSDVTGARYQYKADSSSRWLQMDPSTGLLSGTPTGEGVYEITVMAANEDFVYAEQKYTLTVAAAEGLNISSTAVTEATTNEAYSYQVSIINETGTPTYALATDKTADWLTIDQSGLLSGTPTVAETIHVTVTVTDDNGSATQEFDLVISEGVGVANYNIHSVNMYPNPCSSILYLENLPEKTQLELFDMTGKMIKHIIPGAPSTELEVSDLNNGIYILKITGMKESLTRRLLVK